MVCWRRALLGAVTASLVAVPSVTASPPQSASGTIVITGQVVTSARQAGPNTIITGVTTFTLSGDVSGPASYEFRQVNHADGSLNSSGIVTCACTIQGRTGTAVFRIEGTGSLGPPVLFSGHSTVVDATGGLEGLHGVFTFDQVGFTATYEGQYHFEP
jgi:hypothetical protein